MLYIQIENTFLYVFIALNHTLSNVFLNFSTKLIPTSGIVKSSSSEAEMIDSGVIYPAS